MLVHKLVGLCGDAQVTLKRTVECKGDEEHHGQKFGQPDKKNALKPSTLHMEKQAKHDAAGRSGQQHVPYDARQSRMHGIESLSPLLDQLIERAQGLGVE